MLIDALRGRVFFIPTPSHTTNVHFVEIYENNPPVDSGDLVDYVINNLLCFGLEGEIEYCPYEIIPMQSSNRNGLAWFRRIV